MSKIGIKKVQTWMGTTYRIYISGMYMARGLDSGHCEGRR